MKKMFGFLSRSSDDSAEEVEQQQQIQVQSNVDDLQVQSNVMPELQLAGAEAAPEEHEEKPKEKKPPRKMKVKKASGNVVVIPLGKLADDPNTVTGDAVFCKSCKGVLSSVSVVKKEEDKATWTW